MFSDTLIETDDKSFFTDELEKLTGRPRSFWAAFTLFALKQRLRWEVEKKALRYIQVRKPRGELWNL